MVHLNNVPKAMWCGAKVVAVSLLGLSLLACESGGMSDLESYTQQVLVRKSKKITPLPEIKPYEVYAYQSGKAKDPFQPFFSDEPEQIQQTSSGGIQPDFNRNREELESFPLDSLRMVGTIEQGGESWGIVQSSDSSVHRVQIDNYMGRNHGKIINIQEDSIELIEIAPDGLGGWVERSASLALVE